MKVGDAGETFLVFETEEDIPDDLVTSPLLTPTSTAPQDIPPAKLDTPELDLNATPQDQSWTQRQHVHSAPKTPSSGDVTSRPVQ